MSDRTPAFASAISTEGGWRAALDDAAARVLEALRGEAPDLALLFTTPHHVRREDHLGRSARERLKARTLVGVSAQAVIGGGREVEEGPALALFVARLAGIEARPFAIPAQEDPEPPIEAWRKALPVGAEDRGLALLFADPFTIDLQAFLDESRTLWPDLPLAGGIASGGMRPGQNRLYLDDATHEGGAVGVFLRGAEVRTVVSQGCRPIGKHLVITKAHGNVIEQIGGKPALEVLRTVVLGLGEADQKLATRALHVGRVIDERQDAFKRGDFLIRNPIGADPGSGALAVADTFRPGQTIQFHVRDGAAADEDLRQMLRETGGPAGRGALLFTCNGRGKRFFGVPDHDTKVMAEILGPLPVAGFFCGGEIGPVGGRNFLHGFTSSIVLF